MATTDIKALTCYFTREERRLIEKIADTTERPSSKIVQFAVRAFGNLYERDPKQAMELAKPGQSAGG